MSDDDKRIINDLRRINDLTMWDKVILASQAADRLESLTRTPVFQDPVTDDPHTLVNMLRFAVRTATGDCHGVGVMTQAADWIESQLESLTRAKEVPELSAPSDDTIPIRVACVASQTSKQSCAIFIEPGEAALQCIVEANRYVRNSTHECIGVIHVPRKNIVPTIQAEVEVPK